MEENQKGSFDPMNAQDFVYDEDSVCVEHK